MKQNFIKNFRQIDPGHKVCAYENKHFGAWEKKEKFSFPWSLFFNYYELKAIDSDTGEHLSTYFERQTKLNGLFDRICRRIEKIIDYFGRKK